jgi:plastocyanin
LTAWVRFWDGRPIARLALATILAVLAGAAPALAANAAVTTSGNSFSPAGVTISAGEKVTWTNPSQGQHNVHFEDNQFDVPADPSGTWPPDVSRTFSGPGSYAYYCELHGGPGGSGMSGTVTVTGTTYTFTGATNGVWEEATNWTPQGIPGTSPTDIAVIPSSKNVHAGGDHAVATLNVTGPNPGGRSGPGTLTVTQGGTWTNAVFNGGKTVIGANATVGWPSGRLWSGEVENLGTLNAGSLAFGFPDNGTGSMVLDNHGVMTLAGTLTLFPQYAGVVQNPGTLSGNGTIGPPLSNSGTVTAQGGLLELKGSVTPNPGDYVAAPAATLRFGGATTGETGARVSGAGTVEVAAITSFPSTDAEGWAVTGTTRITSVLLLGGGSTGTLDLDGSFAPSLAFVAGAGSNSWTGNVAAAGQVTVQGAVTLADVNLWATAKLRLAGPSTLTGVEFGNGDQTIDAAPELQLSGPATLSATTTFADQTAGGAPKLAVLEGGSLTLGPNHLTVQAPFTTAGTLGVKLDSASDFGRLTATGPVTLGGALAVTGAFLPGDPLRVITAPAEPSGSFASVTAGFETVRDATGVLLKTAPIIAPTPSPTPSPSPSAAPSPTATATPAPTVQPLVTPRFASLVRLPKCATRRSLRVQLRLPAASARVLIKRKLIKTLRGTKAVTLKKLPKRAFTLSFEVKLGDGRTVKASKKFRACKTR